jgi:hypothetical protein
VFKDSTDLRDGHSRAYSDPSICRPVDQASTFQDPQLPVNNFGYNAGGWRVDQHPRFVVDTTGDGRADIIGFGNAGVYVSRS